MHLTDIYLYPIKSLGGIRLEAATVQREGLQHDRRWMLLDADGKFMTQRTVPEMALLKPSLQPDTLRIAHADGRAGHLDIPFDEVDSPPFAVQVWDDELAARSVNRQADAWLSEALGQSCQLVRTEPGAIRYSLKGQGGKYVSFADAQPYLIIGEGSLADLNRRLDRPVPMSRFRPNFVFAEGQAYVEDSWEIFALGEVHFENVKPCGRCSLTSVDQVTGKKMGQEPLRTLGTYRMAGNSVNFGMLAKLAVGQGEATVRVGDRVMGK